MEYQQPPALILELFEEGYDVKQCIDILCDGEALKALGVTDAGEAEDLYDFLLSLADAA